jgi:CheY-like chemotaxis protein/DNA-binding Lrp family transcriptional regulator
MTERILIIDDEPEIRRNLTMGLTQENYTCTACPDGISAVHELHNSREKGVGYDYLITDIFMPDIDGLKILKVIKKEFPELPVLVITAFGDDMLKATALAEENTGFLDKPFEIEELVAALKELKPGTTTLDPSQKVDSDVGTMRESISAYLTIRITDAQKSMEIFDELYNLEGVTSCEAVRGDVDIIMLVQASAEEGINLLKERVMAINGIEVVSMSQIERPKLDRDVEEFISVYQKAVKQTPQQEIIENRGTMSYIIADIDKDSIKQIFTTVFFIDDVVFCDVIDNGTKLVGMVTSSDPVGRMPKIIEKLQQIDGVLRVKEAKIIKLMDV